MARLLAALSYTVTTAKDLETARRLVAAQPFDLIVSDIGLPDGSGLDLLRWLRARGGVQIPALAVSGDGKISEVSLDNVKHHRYAIPTEAGASSNASVTDITVADGRVLLAVGGPGKQFQ